MIEEVSSEMENDLKEQVKQIESGILEKIKSYQDNLKAHDDKYNQLRKLESKGYLLLQQVVLGMKKNKDISELEEKLHDVNMKIDEAKIDLIESQRSTLAILQILYRDHVEYLSNVTNGLKAKCDKLENNRK